MYSSVQHNGGFLPGIILLTQCYCHRGTRSNAMKRFCICSPCSHLNVLTFSPLIGGCSKGLDVFRFFLNNNHVVVKSRCGLVVKRRCIYLCQLQYCTISCVLDDKLLLYKARVDVTIAVCTGRPGSSEVPRNPLTRWDVSSIPANGIFLTKKLKT